MRFVTKQSTDLKKETPFKKNYLRPFKTKTQTKKLNTNMKNKGSYNKYYSKERIN